MKLRWFKANVLIIAKCILLLFLPLKVQAFHLPNVYVFSEGDDQDSRDCNFYNAAGVAKAESVFRQNRIQINESSRYNFYINITIIKIQNVDGCIANVTTKLFFNEFVAFPTDPQKKSFMGVVLADKNITITSSPSSLENKILNKITSFTEQAISSVEKRWVYTYDSW